jgi:cysteinyl-tRNA synthetase
MDDDFNTPVALAELQRLRGDVNKLLGHGLSSEARRRAREEFRLLGSNLGLFPLELDAQWQFNERMFGTGAVAAGSATMAGAGPVLTPGTESLQVSGTTPTVKEELSHESVEAKIAQRNDARRKKDFKTADEIRKYLSENGIIIEDKPDGTSRWKR